MPCTAPTSQQMFDVLWKEVALWHGRMPEGIKALFEVLDSYVRIKERYKTWFARAATGRKENPEALAGVHGEHVALIADEASGVHEVIFETVRGALTNANIFLILISNPTRLSGFFYNAHHRNRQKWQALRFDSRESPLVDHGFVEDIIDDYGEESPQFSIRVKGDFPASEEDQLISNELFDASAARPKATDIGYVRSLGVDVARYGGDRTALVERQGGSLEVRKIRHDQDTVATANDVMVELKVGREQGNPYDFVFVDVIGVGAGVYDTLKDRQKNSEIPKSTRLVAVNVSETAEKSEEHMNKRVELWHRFKKWLETGSVDPKLKEESCAVKYGKPDAKGRNTLEPKEHTKERIGLSPDLADAGILTFAIGPMRRAPKETRKPGRQITGWQRTLQGR